MGMEESAGRQARMVAIKAEPWIERFARFGYGAKGVVYSLIGVLAIRAAFSPSHPSNSRGALASLADEPFGQVLLGIVGVGLIGYALWRLVEAFADAEQRGHDARGIIRRIGYGISGLIYAALAWQALRLAFGSGGGNTQSDSTSSRTATLMSQPFGVWLVGLVGVCIIVYGLYQLRKASRSKPRERLDLAGTSPTMRTWSIRLSRFGIASRGVVFLIIGTFLIVAAVQHQPSEARGVQGALSTLEQTSFGPWLLAIVGLGLLSYGIYQFLQARYRRIDA